jgi:hypothetical protein
VPTLVMVVAIVAIAAAMAVVGELAAVAPFVGPILSAVVLQAVVAYVTLVVVGEYVALHREEGLPAEQAAGEPLRDGLPE